MVDWKKVKKAESNTQYARVSPSTPEAGADEDDPQSTQDSLNETYLYATRD